MWRKGIRGRNTHEQFVKSAGGLLTCRAQVLHQGTGQHLQRGRFSGNVVVPPRVILARSSRGSYEFPLLFARAWTYLCLVGDLLLMFLC